MVYEMVVEPFRITNNPVLFETESLGRCLMKAVQNDWF
jgi:hypothetical protein